MSVPFTPEQEERLRQIIREEIIEWDLAIFMTSDSTHEKREAFRVRVMEKLNSWHRGGRGHG